MSRLENFTSILPFVMIFKFRRALYVFRSSTNERTLDPVFSLVSLAASHFNLALFNTQKSELTHQLLTVLRKI